METIRRLVFVFLLGGCSDTSLSETTLTCNSDDFLHRLSCDDGLIMVRNVTLSNRESEECVDGVRPRHLEPALCPAAPVLRDIQKRCDGRYRCEVNMYLCHTARPCLTRCVWMETSHTCERGRIYHVCQKQKAHLSCGGQVIKMLTASYGRTSRYVCEYNAFWWSDNYCVGPGALRVMANRCDGKHRCSVWASNLMFPNPCPGTKKYLQYSYMCVDS